MIQYNLDDVTDDMILGKSLFLPNGELLLAAGYHITEQYRSRLKQLGFSSVYIQVDGTEDVIPETIISEHLQREISISLNKNTKELKKSFIVRQEGVKNIRRTIRENKQYLNKFLSNSGLINSLEKIIDEILNQPSVVLNMSALLKSNSDLFSHAINVTIISLAIGKKFHFSYDEMKQLAMGAINYDIGFIAIPKEILKKNGNFSSDDEKELFMQHTVYGYLMLSQNPSISATAAAVALQHHEFQDGSGYPRSLPGENRYPLKDFSRKNVIHRFSEIVTVADTYDMLTTGRMNKIHDIQSSIRKLIELGGKKLNKEIVKSLAKIVPIYPVGTRIKIFNSPTVQLIGYYGVVAKLNPDNMEKPQIILYETKNHKKIKPILIDLSLHTGFELDVLT
jgi:HD-GYP domain-containing protein (c-di-GMP phosphodiesterase class II)